MRPALALLLAILLPGAAFAQASPADIAYCNRLADIYDRYLGRSDNSPYPETAGGTLDGEVASVHCREGKPAGAIPVLEQQLRRSGFTLPPRG